MKRAFPLISLLLIPLAIGCGPAGQHFHGTYSASGTISLTVTDYGSETGQAEGTRFISEGTTSDLVLSDANRQCLLPANVQGDVATFTPGASCTQVINNTTTVTRTITSGTASISGNVVQVHISGTLMMTNQGKSYPGSYSENTTLTRVAK